MIDVPCDPPPVQTCQTCGRPADIVLVLRDGTAAAACLRDRAALPAPGFGSQRRERRFGRWCSGTVRVTELVGSRSRLLCESCGATGEVVWVLRTDDARWETVSCRRCVPPRMPRHSAAVWYAQAAWSESLGVWKAPRSGWWPRQRYDQGVSGSASGRPGITSPAS